MAALIESALWGRTMFRSMQAQGLPGTQISTELGSFTPPLELFAGVAVTASILGDLAVQGSWVPAPAAAADVSAGRPHARPLVQLGSTELLQKARQKGRDAGWENGMAWQVFLSLLDGTKSAWAEAAAYLDTSTPQAHFDSLLQGTKLQYQPPAASEPYLAASILAAWNTNPFLAGGDPRRKGKLAQLYAQLVVLAWQAVSPTVSITGTPAGIPPLASYDVVLA